MPKSKCLLARQESLSDETKKSAKVADTRSADYFNGTSHGSSGLAAPLSESKVERPGGVDFWHKAGPELEIPSRRPPATTVMREDTKPKPKQAIALGEHFYLFQGNPGQAGQKLVISAHGEYLPGMHTRVPENTKLVCYGPDGKILMIPGLKSVVNGCMQVYEEIGPHSRIRNYLLSKVEYDTYEFIEQQVMETGVDVLSVRNRKNPRLSLKNSMISLNDVLIELEKNGIHYNEIHCLLCRGSMLNPFAGKFLAPEVPRVKSPASEVVPPAGTFSPARPDADLLDPLNGYEFLKVQPKADL